jgi:putative ABC transport system permease protein
VQQTAFFEQVFDELRRDPAVTEAAAAIGLPFSGLIPSSSYVVAGSPVPPLTQRPLAGLSIVSEDYFKVMRIGLVEGRTFTAGDREGAPGVCVINASLARRLFPGQSALGRVMLRGPNADIRNQIVGVIRDVKTNGLTVPTPDEIYFPMRQFGRAGMNVVARTRGDAAALEPVLRRAVAAVDRHQPTAAFTTLDQSIAASLGAQRIVASLTTVFATLALVLSSVGLYSAVAYVVSQRRSEIGIRMALGARQSQVIGLFMRMGLRLVAAGLAVGLGAAAGVSRLIQTLLFDVQPLDAAVYAAVAASFTVIAALACLVPSWRAAKIDPLLALRAE